MDNELKDLIVVAWHGLLSNAAYSEGNAPKHMARQAEEHAREMLIRLNDLDTPAGGGEK